MNIDTVARMVAEKVTFWAGGLYNEFQDGYISEAEYESQVDMKAIAWQLEHEVESLYKRSNVTQYDKRQVMLRAMKYLVIDQEEDAPTGGVFFV